jgi:hypothetical protein
MTVVFRGAGTLELDLLVEGLAVLSGEGDLGGRPMGAEIAGVDQVSVLAAEDDEVEVADRRIGYDGDRGPQATGEVCGFGAGDEVDLAAEEEGESGQAAAA